MRPSASPTPSGIAPALVFALALLGGFLVLAAASILLALLVVHVLVSGSRLGWPARRKASTRRLPTTATARSPRSKNRLAGRRRPGPADPRRPHRPRCAVLRRWLIAAFAVFVLLAESATYASRRSWFPGPTVSPPAGRSAGRRQLSLGAHRRLRRGLLRPRTPAHHPFHQQPVEGAGTGAILLTTFVALSRMFGHAIRSPSPAASSSGRSWCCCLPAARPARPRRRS